MADSTLASSTRKPRKPRDFPLWEHPNGQFCKKINGRAYYFGRVADGWQPALERYNREAEYLKSGKAPPLTEGELTLADLCNRFLTSKKLKLESDEIVPATFKGYLKSCERLVKLFGRGRLVSDLAPADFDKLRAKLAKTYAPSRLGTEVQLVRTVFKFALEVGLVEKPIRIGPDFKRPAKRILRVHRHKQGERMFEADELRQLLDAADQPLKAMILLGVNCGFGPGDCGRLTVRAVDLKRGWIDFPRRKTGVKRRCAIWPETVAALKEAIDKRPKPKSKRDADLVFVTKYGAPWMTEAGSSTAVSHEFRKLLDTTELYRRGRAFYALRHTFETIGGESLDQVAVSHVMGHIDDTMAAHYRERISDGRLRVVADHVRQWLFGAEGGEDE